MIILRKFYLGYLLSQAHMCPHGWKRTAAFLSEHTTHSSICEKEGTAYAWTSTNKLSDSNSSFCIQMHCSSVRKHFHTEEFTTGFSSVLDLVSWSLILTFFLNTPAKLASFHFSLPTCLKEWHRKFHFLQGQGEQIRLQFSFVLKLLLKETLKGQTTEIR